MNGNVEAIVFENRDGKKLFATLHSPPCQKPQNPTVVLLSPGVKMRVGPHRLYNRLTEVLTNLGYSVFKFDFVGLGDSEGELERDLLSEVYNDTEKGMFVNDGTDALNWLEKNRGATEFILGGLCGGAVTGILLAKDEMRVKGLISLGTNVTLSKGSDNRSEFASQKELENLRKGYLRRLKDPKSWLRLLTFKSDFRTMFRSLYQRLSRKPRRIQTKNPTAISVKSNANPFFPPAFFSMTETGRKILMVFSGSDRLYWDYEEKFAQPYLDRLNTVVDSYEVRIIKNANHVFSFREWDKEMHSHVTEWLMANFTRE